MPLLSFSVLEKVIFKSNALLLLTNCTSYFVYMKVTKYIIDTLDTLLLRWCCFCLDEFVFVIF